MKGIIFEFVKGRNPLTLRALTERLDEIFESKYQCTFDFDGIDMSTFSIVVKVVTTEHWDVQEVMNLFKSLEEVTKDFNDVAFITAEQSPGIEIVNCRPDMLTDGFKEVLKDMRSIIKTIVLTCDICPEQYDCFDEYGNQIAYFRLRHGCFTVECPDCVTGFTVYSNEDTKGDGCFYDDDERTREFIHAINAVNQFYESRHFITRTIAPEESENDFIYKIKDGVEMHEVLEALFYYQKSNFFPREVIELRSKGPVLGYRDALHKIIKKHRLQRNRMFPEANGRDGLSEDHIEHEVEFFKTTIDGLGGMVKNVNELYDKKFEDFEEYFRESCKKGWNSL